MITTRMFLWSIVKLFVVALVTVALFGLVINAMKGPAEGNQNAYSADFTDVSGLRENADVRSQGVKIGKVTAIELKSADDGRQVAHVEFTMDDDTKLTSTTELAVKYQNLTGIRYVDVSVDRPEGAPVRHVGVEQTKPSFDITSLFNGLQPVLSTMNTQEINAFTQNALSVLQGDGSGLAPMLDSVQTLADYAVDREAAISTLVANMSRIADSMGGRSPQVIDFMKSLSVTIDGAVSVLDLFPKTASFGPAFLAPINRLMNAIGLNPNMDLDKMIGDAFASATEAAKSLRLLPGALAGLQLPTANPASTKCSNGLAQLPTDVEVFLKGSGVVLCNPK